MAYPNTDWPGATDAVLTRVNLVDIVDADDFNYQDKEIRALQDWLSDGQGGIIGDNGVATDGPGGALSPIASGGTAFTIAARASYAGGNLLAVVDNYDVAAATHLTLDFDGNLTAVGNGTFSDLVLCQVTAAPAELETSVKAVHGAADIGYLTFSGQDAGGGANDYAQIAGVCDDDLVGHEDGSIVCRASTDAAFPDVAILSGFGNQGLPGWYDEVETISSNANVSDVDMMAGFIKYELLTENTTFGIPANPLDGMILTLILKQEAGKSYTVAFNAIYLLAGAAFTMTAPVGYDAYDVLRFVYSSTNSKWVEISRTQDVH